jgi:long-chain acyl-CoA synthetase
MVQYPYNNFYEILESNEKRFAKKPIIFLGKEKVTNQELKVKVDNLANYLDEQDISKGDKVAIILGNSTEFIISLFAITKLGAIAVPVNNFLKHEELGYIIENCQAKIVISSSDYKDELLLIKDIKSDFLWIDTQDLSTKFNYNESSSNATIDDLAVIIYTSGTTGNPKGAMLSYKNIFSNINGANEVFGFNQKDRFIVYLPMFHSFTLSIMVLLPLFNASAIVIVTSIFPFSNVLKETLLKRVTVFLGVPTVYNALIKAKIPWYFMWFNKIRAFVSGSAPLSQKVLNDFKEKFPRATLLEGYGLSECSPAVSINKLEKQKALSVGTPLPNYEVKIVDDELLEVKTGDVGEIIVKGDCVMQGYLNNQEATDSTIKNGWLLSGDFGKVDEDGFIYIVDRKKDLIISKGINIYPREIEEVIMHYDGIEACAVIGEKDDNLDEKVVAYIEAKENIKLDEKDIKKYLKEHLANFKLPKQIYIIDKLPRNATGKVLKRELKC